MGVRAEHPYFPNASLQGFGFQLLYILMKNVHNLQHWGVTENMYSNGSRCVVTCFSFNACDAEYSYSGEIEGLLETISLLFTC